MRGDINDFRQVWGRTRGAAAGPKAPCGGAAARDGQKPIILMKFHGIRSINKQN